MTLAAGSTPMARSFAKALLHRITSEDLALPPLYDKQEQFVMSEARHAAFVAGIGSGKSWAGAVRAHRAAMGWIGSRKIITPNLGMFTAPTEDMIRKATLRTFLEIADRDIVSHNKNEKLIVLRNGSEIYYASTQHPDRLRGPSISWWWGDEAAFYEAVVRKIMIGRLRQHGRLGYDWLTTTPKGRNWVWQTFVQAVPEAARDQYLLIKASSRENTFQDSEVVEMWEREYVGDFARQELDAEFVAFEGLIYNEFDRGRHVRSAMPQYPRYVAGVDWGFANPGVIVVVGVDGDGGVGITRLMHERQTRIEEWVNIAVQLRGIYGIGAWYCDPSSPDNIRKFVDAGLKAEPANNTVQTGIQAVKNRLVGLAADGWPRLTITQDAVELIDEFESYQWAENRHGLRDEPVKAKDHALDALRYAIMGIDHPKVRKVEAEARRYA